MKAAALKKKEQAMQKLADMEAAKQLKWRQLVMEAPEAPIGVNFYGLDGWKASFEKEKKAKGNKGKSNMQKKAEASAKQALLDKVRDSLTTKIMIVSTEVLEATEAPLREGADTPLSPGAVVNCINGVVLSYFFGFNKKKNFPYLRRFASDHMTAIVVGIFESSADSAGAAAELTGKITAVIESKQALAIELITSHIEALMEAEAEMEIGAIEDMLPEKVLKEGILRKKSGSKKHTWQDRHIQLTNRGIEWDKDAGSKFGSVPLADIVSVSAVDSDAPGSMLQIETTVKNAKTYELLAANDKERDSWIAAITKDMAAGGAEASAVAAAAAAEEAKAKIEVLMRAVADQAVPFAVSKMDHTIGVLCQAVSTIVSQMEGLYSAALAAGGDSVVDGRLSGAAMDQLKDDIFAIVTGEYNKAELTVQVQVEGLVSILGKVMSPHVEEDEE